MRNILPTLISIMTKHSRDVVNFEWCNKSWTFNIFRMYEYLFGRRTGVRREAFCDGHTFYALSFEAKCVHIENLLRQNFRHLFESRPRLVRIPIWMPQFAIIGDRNTPIRKQQYVYAIAFDTSVNQQTNSGGAALTFSFTTTGTNRFLVVGDLVQSSATISSATYSAVTMTQAATVSTANVASGETSYIHVLGAPASGANNVVLTPSASATVAAVASSYSGAQQTSVVEASNTATGTGNSGTASVTTITDNDWLVAYLRANGTISTAGANTTFRGTPGGLGMSDSNAVQTPPGSFAQNFTATGGTGEWGMIVIALKPFVEATSGKNFFMFMG